MSADDERFSKGLAVAQRLFGPLVSRLTLPDDFRRYTMAHLFGDVWQGPALAIEERSLLTCTVLVTLNREAEQRLHFTGAKNLGIPREKIEALITHVGHYAGWPVAVSAFRVLEEVWPPSAK